MLVIICCLEDYLSEVHCHKGHWLSRVPDSLWIFGGYLCCFYLMIYFLSVNKTVHDTDQYRCSLTSVLKGQWLSSVPDR